MLKSIRQRYYSKLNTISLKTLRKLIKWELKPNSKNIKATLEFDRRLYNLLQNIEYN